MQTPCYVFLKIKHVPPSHQKQVLSESDTAFAIGVGLMSDFSPGFGEVCTVDGGDGETPVASSSDTASTRSDYCSSE